MVICRVYLYLYRILYCVISPYGNAILLSRLYRTVRYLLTVNAVLLSRLYNLATDHVWRHEAPKYRRLIDKGTKRQA